MSPTAFFRTRHVTFPKLLTLMLSGMCGSIQQELDQFAANLRGSTDLQREVTAQAFSKVRFSVFGLPSPLRYAVVDGSFRPMVSSL